jgi:hypothetical protein
VNGMKKASRLLAVGLALGEGMMKPLQRIDLN